jgi:hypothetical protein
MGETYEERVEKLAQKLFHGGDGNDSGATDIETARRTARTMIEDSDARTAQAAELDPDDDDVIRRSSSETAATGESSHPQTSDGE